MNIRVTGRCEKHHGSSQQKVSIETAGSEQRNNFAVQSLISKRKVPHSSALGSLARRLLYPAVVDGSRAHNELKREGKQQNEELIEALMAGRRRSGPRRVRVATGPRISRSSGSDGDSCQRHQRSFRQRLKKPLLHLTTNQLQKSTRSPALSKQRKLFCERAHGDSLFVASLRSAPPRGFRDAPAGRSFPR